MDALALLTGADVPRLLAPALLPGEELLDWRARSVDHRPDVRTTVAYEVRLRTAADEQPRVLGACAGPDLVPQVWRFPDDPELPGLARATDEAAVVALLLAYGVGDGSVELRVRSYRPRSRALVEVRTGGLLLHLKVLRPAAGPALHDRHVLLRSAGLPVPRSLGRRDDGLLVLEGLPGQTLRQRVREGDAAPDGAALVELLDALPPQVCALPARRSWSDDVALHARTTGAVLPSEADRCRRLAERVLAATAGLPADGPVHGDLHEAQLLVDGPRVTALLDLDAVGPGRRADDLACLLAHAHVLAASEPAHRTSTLALAAGWLAEFEARVDPVELRARTAGVLVALATGPHRVQSDGWQDATRERLDLAEGWLDRADRPYARR